MIGDEKADPSIPPPSESVRHRISPVFLSSLATDAPAWTYTASPSTRLYCALMRWDEPPPEILGVPGRQAPTLPGLPDGREYGIRLSLADVKGISGAEVDRILALLDRGRVGAGPDDGVPVVGKGQKPTPPDPAATPVAAEATGPRGRGRRRQAGAARQATPWGATELDVRVQIPENLLLRGQDIRRDSAAAGLGDMSLVVGGDFRVQKERRRPTTHVGTVTTARGSGEPS